MNETLDVERAVRERYSRGAAEKTPALCCTIQYDPRLLEAIPREVLERDYGCGDPSRYVREGDTVLDLGSGGGKICFIASQVAGPKGRVIGVDMNDDMLALARGAAPEVARRVGYGNVEFRRGRIQDLALDLDLLDGWLMEHPVRSSADLDALDEEEGRLRRDRPMIADGSVDIVVSNCVLNLVRDDQKARLIREIHRVVRPGGRIAISDIVSDEEIPADLKQDPELWSGCISGAFREDLFIREFEKAGFHGVRLESWNEEPFRTVRGIEFHSVVVTARKAPEGAGREASQAVIYRGPWRRVEDDQGRTFRRGERTAVSDRTYEILTGEPYAGDLLAVPPREEIPPDRRARFEPARPALRHPRETKGEGSGGGETPGGGGSCCGSGENRREEGPVRGGAPRPDEAPSRSRGG